MYLDFYGLLEEPFGVTPDSRFLYPSPAHREALASLIYGVEAGRGFVVLSAEPGMGKTTLLFEFLERMCNSTSSAFLFHTQCDSREFLRYVLTDMGIESKSQDIVEMHEQLNQALIQIHQSGKKFVLVIDEAQNLTDEVLEAVRLLSDFETPSSKLMQIVLSGQPQLADKLLNPALTQLRQRISVFCRLNPFTREETGDYIRHRLAFAGRKTGSMFTREAHAIIADYSKGIPRNINNLCFNALSLGCATGRNIVGAETLREVLADLNVQSLSAVSNSAKPAPVAAISSPASPQPNFVEAPPVLGWRRFAAAVALTSVLVCLLAVLLQAAYQKFRPTLNTTTPSPSAKLQSLDALAQAAKLQPLVNVLTNTPSRPQPSVNIPAQDSTISSPASQPSVLGVDTFILGWSRFAAAIALASLVCLLIVLLRTAYRAFSSKHDSLRSSPGRHPLVSTLAQILAGPQSPENTSAQVSAGLQSPMDAPAELPASLQSLVNTPAKQYVTSQFHETAPYSSRVNQDLQTSVIASSSAATGESWPHAKSSAASSSPPAPDAGVSSARGRFAKTWVGVSEERYIDLAVPEPSDSTAPAGSSSKADTEAACQKLILPGAPAGNQIAQQSLMPNSSQAGGGAQCSAPAPALMEFRELLDNQFSKVNLHTVQRRQFSKSRLHRARHEVPAPR